MRGEVMISKNKVFKDKLPSHVAIILDGNGTWAKKRGLSRQAGHKQGALNLRKITLFCQTLGINFLSVYAFSTENWKRPTDEVDYLMGLPKVFEEEFNDAFDEYDIKVVFTGRRDRLSEDNKALLKRVEEDTKHRKGLTLNVGIDYGSQDEIVRAAGKWSVSNEKAIDTEKFALYLDTAGMPSIDLLIRPGGHMRLSNYMLWQAAYAELYFTKTTWPAFNEKALLKALKSYQKRVRKFGGLKGGGS